MAGAGVVILFLFLVRARARGTPGRTGNTWALRALMWLPTVSGLVGNGVPVPVARVARR